MPDLPTTDELDAIEARCNAATAGPWDEYAIYQTLKQHERNCHACWHGDCHYILDRDADSPFIAHAREDLPRLLAAVRALLAEREQRQTAAPK